MRTQYIRHQYEHSIWHRLPHIAGLHRPHRNRHEDPDMRRLLKIIRIQSTKSVISELTRRQQGGLQSQLYSRILLARGTHIHI